MELRKKTRSSSIVVSLTLAMFLVVGGFLVYQNTKLFQKRAELLKRTRELQAEIYRLTKEGAQLQASIAENQTPEYQEKVLREQGLYKKPGEQVVTILPPQTQTQVQQPPKKKPWWQPWTWFK